MPRILCKCEEVLDLGDIDISYKYISEKEYDEYHGQIDSEKLYLDMKSFFICPTCGRLWMYSDGFENEPKEYILNPSE